jgi:hypothetical protein
MYILHPRRAKNGKEDSDTRIHVRQVHVHTSMYTGILLKFKFSLFKNSTKENFVEVSVNEINLLSVY